MARQRRKSEKEEEKREEDGEEVKVKSTTTTTKRTVSRRNIQSLIIGVVGAALTLGAYSQTFVSPGQSIGAGLLVLFFGLLVSEGFLTF